MDGRYGCRQVSWELHICLKATSRTDFASVARVNSRVYMSTAYVTQQDVPVAELEKLAEALMDGLVSAIATRAQASEAQTEQ